MAFARRTVVGHGVVGKDSHGVIGHVPLRNHPSIPARIKSHMAVNLQHELLPTKEVFEDRMPCPAGPFALVMWYYRLPDLGVVWNNESLVVRKVQLVQYPNEDAFRMIGFGKEVSDSQWGLTVAVSSNGHEDGHTAVSCRFHNCNTPLTNQPDAFDDRWEVPRVKAF